MKRLLLIGLVGIAGCEPLPQNDWDTAPVTHICTTEQMTRVQNEALWCDSNTSYYSTYCYGTAIIRNCQERGKTP